MKRHVTGFGISALLHAGLVFVALPVLLSQPSEPPAKPQPLTLELATFQPAPPPPVSPAPPITPTPAPQAVAKPAPPPVPKPIIPAKPVVKAVVATPKPKPKPIPKPEPESKPKPISKAEPKREAKPAPPVEPKPEPVAQPTATAQHAAPRQPSAPVAPHPTAVAKPAPVAPRLAAVARPESPVPAPKPMVAANNPAAEAAYRAKLQSLIAARKRYPSMAEKMEAEGTVEVAFTVLPNGTITGARVANSSGNQWLDQAAVQAVQVASGALPFPPDIRKAQWAFTIGVDFRLE